MHLFTLPRLGTPLNVILETKQQYHFPRKIHLLLQEVPALMLAELMSRQKKYRAGLMQVYFSLSKTGKTELAKQTAKYIHKDIKKVMAHLSFVLALKGMLGGSSGGSLSDCAALRKSFFCTERTCHGHGVTGLGWKGILNSFSSTPPMKCRDTFH